MYEDGDVIGVSMISAVDNQFIRFASGFIQGSLRLPINDLLLRLPFHEDWFASSSIVNQRFVRYGDMGVRLVPMARPLLDN